MKLFTILACILASASTPLPAAPLTPTPEYNAIRLIECEDVLGTGFVIADGIVVTALHLASHKGCIDAGTNRPLTTYLRDKVHDFALMTMDTKDIPYMPYSCQRYKTAERYFSYGYGIGKPMMQVLVALDRYDMEMRDFLGTIVQGQSGGPVVDIKGVAHGINNMSNYVHADSLSAELADTALCKR